VIKIIALWYTRADSKFSHGAHGEHGDNNLILLELLAKITFLQEAPKMEIAKLLWHKE
jgi:hypothetical protein